MTGQKIVIVSGAGRSGTSAAAGCLKHLGYVVPPPELEPNAANPRGYFEPRWAINFHKRLLRRASVQTMDARPWALELVEKAAADGPFQKQLIEWLGNAFDNADHLVVKDPRAFWARKLWLRAAEAAEAETAFLTMLRHPAEVIGSRDTYYASKSSDERRAAGIVHNLAGWINSTLVNESTSRDYDRAFLLYADLLGDWRSAMTKVDEALDLRVPPDLFSSAGDRVDEFIDPSLYRVHVTWEDLRVPRDMRDLAERVWSVLASEGHDSLQVDAARLAELDAAQAAYRQMFTDAVALVTDQINTLTRQANRQTRKRVAAERRQQTGDASPAAGRPSTPRGGVARSSSSQAAGEQGADASDPPNARRAAGAARARGRKHLLASVRRAGGKVRAGWRRRRASR